jgi:hypothetical protein
VNTLYPVPETPIQHIIVLFPLTAGLGSYQLLTKEPDLKPLSVVLVDQPLLMLVEF